MISLKYPANTHCNMNKKGLLKEKRFIYPDNKNIIIFTFQLKDKVALKIFILCLTFVLVLNLLIEIEIKTDLIWLLTMD